MSSKPVSSAPKRNPNTKALSSSSNKGMIITVLALLVVAALVLAGVVWYAKKDSGTGSVTLGQAADPDIELTDKGVVAIGDPAAPTIEVYEDFMCPGCGSFESTWGPKIAEAVNGGKLRTEYHMLNFLDRQSASGEYSTRALAAVQCVAQKEKVTTLLAVKSAFFANQPAEGGGDRTADELATSAEQAGAGKDSVDCIRNVETNGGMDTARETADNSIASMRQVAEKLSTPTVVHDGKEVDFSKPKWLDEIITGK